MSRPLRGWGARWVLLTSVRCGGRESQPSPGLPEEEVGTGSQRGRTFSSRDSGMFLSLETPQFSYLKNTGFESFFISCAGFHESPRQSTQMLENDKVAGGEVALELRCTDDRVFPQGVRWGRDVKEEVTRHDSKRLLRGSDSEEGWSGKERTGGGTGPWTTGVVGARARGYGHNL